MNNNKMNNAIKKFDKNNKYDKYSTIVMALVLLQILGFFVLPYAMVNKDMLGGLSGITASSLGIPDYLSAFNIVRSLNSPIGQIFEGCLILLAAPILCCVQLILLGTGKTKAGHIITIIFSILECGVYAIGMLIGELVVAAQYGIFKSGPAGWILIPMAVGALVVSIIGLASGSKTKTSTAPAGKKASGRLIGLSGVYEGACIPVRDGETLVIGRDPRVCNIVLGSLSASRKHCTITYDAYNNTYTVMDYSSNGVFDKNGNRLQKGWKDLMRIGDEIRIANTVEVFRFGF